MSKTTPQVLCTTQPVRSGGLPVNFDIDELLKLENQVCFPLWAAAKDVVRRYTPFLDKLGLTYTQYLVCMVLWEQDGLSVKEIGERLFLDSGTLTPLLKKLELQGVIVRVRSKSDERSVQIFLTDQGQELKQRAATVPLHIADCIKLEPQEALQLVHILRKLLENNEPAQQLSD